MSVWRRVDLWNCRASVCLSVRLSVRSIIRPPHAAAAGLLLWARRPADIDRFLHGRRSAANASNVTCSARKLNTQTCHCCIISSNLWVLFLCPRRPSYRPPGHYVFVLFVRLRACVYARRGGGFLDALLNALLCPNGIRCHLTLWMYRTLRSSTDACIRIYKFWSSHEIRFNYKSQLDLWISWLRTMIGIHRPPGVRPVARASAGFRLGGQCPRCSLRRRKFWKFDYEMVHSEVYWINMWSE